MKFTRLNQLKPGMITARNIYQGDQLMLAANKALTSDIISTLRRNGYSGTYVYDKYSDIEVLSELFDETDRLKMIHAVEVFDTDKVMFFANDIVDSITSDSDIVIDLNQLMIYDQSTYEHSLNVAITSTACGIGMGLSNERLTRLAAGAMLHDCGKEHIPLSILNKPGKLDEDEQRIMHRHTQYGYDMLYNRYDIHPESRIVALCHHENWDGSGYPAGMAGEEIPLLSRIVHVADVYDALIAKRAYKGHVKQSECIEYLMGGGGTMFDYDIVRTFLSYLSVYPVGSDVELSDGRIAHVVENFKGYLERPKVVTEDGTVLDLAHDRNLFNITVLDEVDMYTENKNENDEEVDSDESE